MAIQYPTQLVSMLFFIGYLLAAAIAVGFVIYIARDRSEQPGSVSFGTIALCQAIWALGYVGRMVTTTLEVKLLWTQISWVGITFTPVAVLAFALIFTGRGDLLTRRRIAGLGVIPVLTLAMLFTNDLHGYFYEEVWLHVQPTAVYLASRAGAYFYGVHLPYSWALYAVGTILLIQFAFSTRQIYREQSIALVVGAIIPWVVNGTFLAGVRLHPELDPTPIGFAIGMALIGVAVFRRAFLGLLPLAREQVVEELDDAIIVLDDGDRIVDNNAAATEFLEGFTRDRPTIGSKASEILPEPIAELLGSRSTAAAPEEVHLETANGDAWYLYRTENITNPTYEGRIISLIDITDQKRREASLELARARVERDRDIKEAIQQLLVSTTIDRDVAENICKLLVEEHGFASAWVVPPERTGTEQFIAHHGDDQGFRTATDDQGCDVATRRALESGQPVLFERGDDTPAKIVERLEQCGIEAVFSIPLLHGAMSFGALTAVATSPVTALDIDLLEELADALAFKHHTHRQRVALTTDRVIHVELRIGSGHVLLRLAEIIGQPFKAHELAATNGTVPYLVEFPAGALTPADGAESLPGIEAMRPVAERNEVSVFQVSVQRPTIGSLVREYGGAIQSIAVDQESVTVKLQFPPRTPIAEIAAAVQSEWPAVSIRSRTERPVAVERPKPFETLTDKQENALRAAVVAGFFERPQGSNAAEVAEVLGISRSTFLHHVRAAERKVFSEALDD